MPIDTRELRPSRNALVETITSDRRCGRCGYNLRGLPTNGKCPECGRPIAGTKRGHRRLSDSLSDAPLFYLKTLAWGTGLLALTSVGLAVAFYVANRTGSIAAAGAAGVFAVGWWMGVYIVTAARPFNENTLADAVLDSGWFRAFNRVLAVTWLVGAGASAGFAKVPSVALVWISFIAQGVGILAFAPLGVHLSSLAFWASDTALGERFRMLAWVLTPAGLLVLLGTVGLQFPAATAPGWLQAVGGLLYVGTVWAWMFRGVAMLVFVWSLYQLAHEAIWAVQNSQKASEVAVRLAQREEEHARRIAERSRVGGMLQDPGPAAVINPAKSTYGVNTMQPGDGRAYEVE
jgi:hypothetical protein